MQRIVNHIVALLLLASLFSCGSKEEGIDFEGAINVDSLFVDLGQAAVAKRAKEVDAIFSGIARSGFNGVVLYAEQGQVVYRRAFGVRDLTQRHGDSLRVDDAFQISSDSKMFTAEAIMLLHAQGKLDYDDEVTKFIPEFPYAGVTVRHLLTHCSGLPRYDSMADEFWPDRTQPFSNEAMIAMLVDKKPEPYGTPGGGFFYNNINYALLASVVERVANQHFEDFMRDNIFAPLGMNRSFIYSLRNDSVMPLYMKCEVHGHELYRRGALKVQDFYLNGVMGDKIMFSTVDDIHCFMVALDCNLLMPDSLQNEAFQPGVSRWKRDENYGFGWRMSKEHPDFVYHFGWWKGYKSEIFRNLHENQYLIVLTNTTYNITSSPLWELLEDKAGRLPQTSWNVGAVRRKCGFDNSAEPE